MNYPHWMAMLLILLIMSSCQLVGEDHSPVEGLWFKRESNSLYDIEYAFFADGTFESIGFLRDSDTDKRMEIAFAEAGTYYIAGDRIQFRVGFETPRAHGPLSPLPLPLDSLKTIRNYMALPKNSNTGEQRYTVSEDQLVLDFICPPNANCPGPQTYTRIGEPIKRLR
ncbi:MAG: hypothetical protein KTR29_07595 [Rhodothermaceae bacterium]|nr:hypothetical protein [Rhodothermaceae bacterium]